MKKKFDRNAKKVNIKIGDISSGLKSHGFQNIYNQTCYKQF